jgi:hypothetical protein
LSVGKLKDSTNFKHLVWKRHADSKAWEGALPELVATDGHLVRRLISDTQHIYFQQFEDPNTGKVLQGRVELSVEEGIALLGYSMFTDVETVAILHTGDALEPGWIAFPFTKKSRSAVPTMPIRVASFPKARLVGGASVRWEKSARVIKAAVEQRGQSFLESPHAFNMIEHLTKWELRARVGADGREVKLVKSAEPRDLKRTEEFRLEGTFDVDDVILREFRDDPTLKIWFVVTFDRELFCLPDDWLTFWLNVEMSDMTVSGEG